HRCSVTDHDVFEFGPADGKPTCVVCMGLVGSDDLYVPQDVLRFAMKCLTAAAALADGYGKATSANTFRAARGQLKACDSGDQRTVGQ
ncbi:MAG: hypothetical protein M3Q68_05650, partial [Actinomycetota bacterium]|nr:hypothetical protein [Actinomycetota bacterium]